MNTLIKVIIYSLALFNLQATCQNFTSTMEPPIAVEKVIYFDPPKITDIKEKQSVLISWNTTLAGAHHATYQETDTFVSIVVDFEQDFDFEEGSEITGQGTLNVTMLFIGYNNITLTIYDENNNTLGSEVLVNTVRLAYQFINEIFLYILGVMIFVVYVNMGATLDLEVVRTILKKPIGPIVGLVCQYTIMPVVAFGLAKLFFPDNPLLQLGMFLNGASPGGGQSNIWTYLLGGSLDLSITMTFTSTVVAFAAVPLWVLTLGPTIFEESSFQIPYDRIAILVVSLIVPCGIGILIQKILPKVSKFLSERVLTPVAIFNTLFIVTFGFYANRYIFVIFTWQILLACISLPMGGYISGLVISKLARRTKKEIISISIETGVQNANIAIFILKFSLPQPAGDLTVVIPAAVAILTPLPLITVFLIKKAYNRYKKSGEGEISKPEGKQGESNKGFEEPTNEVFNKKPEINIEAPDQNETELGSRHRNGFTNQAIKMDEVKL